MAQATNTALDNTPKSLPEILRSQASEQIQGSMNMGSQMNDLVNISYEIEKIKFLKRLETTPKGLSISMPPMEQAKKQIKEALTKEFENDEMLVNRSWAAFYGKKKDKLANEMSMLKSNVEENKEENIMSSSAPVTTEKTMLEKAKEFAIKNKWYIGIALVGAAIIWRKPIMKMFNKS